MFGPKIFDQLLISQGKKLCLWVTVFFLFFILSVSSIAQAPLSWSEPIRLNNDDSSRTPFIINDSSGVVHVFWSSFPRESNLSAIFYRQLKNGIWSDPIDIIAASPGAILRPQAVIDDQGWIHLVWLDSGVYYSKVHVSQAGSVRAWSSPQKISNDQAQTPDIFIDDHQKLHVVYVDIFVSPYVHYTNSDNGGESWSAPIRVSDPRNNAYAIDTRIVVDKQDTIHVVWSESIQAFPPSGVYYAQSRDQGQTWTSPLEIARGGYAWISIGIDGQDNLHLFWTGTASAEDNWKAKYHTWSSDGGKSWATIKTVWGNAAGFLGFADMVVDSSGVLHLVSSVGDVSPGEIFFVSWLGDHWSEPYKLSYPILGPNPQEDENNYPQMTISEGNVVHVVWSKLYDVNRQPAEDREWHVWYSTAELVAPSWSVVEIPTPISSMPIVIPTTNIAATSVSIDKTRLQPAIQQFELIEQTADTNQAFPIIISLSTVLALLGGVTVIFIIQRRN